MLLSLGRRAATFIGLTACTALLASAMSASGASSAPSSRSLEIADPMSARQTLAATQVHHVSPVTKLRELKPDYRVTAVGRGYCWTSSFLHPELYRCFLGNYIQDPCWSEAGRQTVICLTRPWSHRVTRLRLTRRLPSSNPGKGAIWGLTMLSGNNCQFASGAGVLFHGERVNYFCRRRWALVGDPNTDRPVWHIQTVRRVHRHFEGRGSRALTDAWRPSNP